MSEHRISISVPDSGASVISLLDLKANDGESIARLGQYIDGIGGGVKTGKVRTNLNAVQAVGTIAFSSFVDADTVTINGVTLTGKTSPSGASQWAVGADDEACANNLVTKINASALDKIVGCVGASRRGTVQLVSFVNADTVTVNGVVFTGKTTPTAGVREEFAIGSSDSVTAQNLLSAVLNSLKKEVAGISGSVSTDTVTFNFLGSLTLAASAHATVASKTVVVTCLIPGQIGNLCTLAISAHGSVSAANLASGTEGTEYVFSKNYSAV